MPSNSQELLSSCEDEFRAMIQKLQQKPVTCLYATENIHFWLTIGFLIQLNEDMTVKGDTLNLYSSQFSFLLTVSIVSQTENGGVVNSQI